MEGQLEPSIIVIFGITGDLSQRYLLPALYHLLKNGWLHEDTEIIGVSRREVSLDEVFAHTKSSLESNDLAADDSKILTDLQARSRMIQMDLNDGQAYEQLHQTLDDIETAHGVCMNRLYYLSIPPQVYQPIITLMGQHQLNTSCQHGHAMTRLLVEKPFGYDQKSAEELINATAEVFGESQVFRIDHFLAKETAQNILTFRFQNPIFESLWNATHISSIEIGASEQIGIEGRAQFYEPLGALRDFIQNHLLQLLAIVTMDQPAAMDSDQLHAVKGAALSQVQSVPADKVLERTKRGQYRGYREEVGVADSTTETYADITVYLDSERWRDVPMRLWTGKHMDQKRYQITLTFKGNSADHMNTNQLRFRLQPNEGIELDLLTKRPGLNDSLQTVAMDFSYQQSFGDTSQPDAYERVLADAIRGDHSLFATGEEVLASWRIVQPVLDEWAKHSDDLHLYDPGSKGPL